MKQVCQFPGLIKKWEGDVQSLSTDSKDVQSDGVEWCILLEMMPAAVTEFMTQRIKEDNIFYQDTKEAILQYVQVKVALGRAQWMAAAWISTMPPAENIATFLLMEFSVFTMDGRNIQTARVKILV